MKKFFPVMLLLISGIFFGGCVKAVVRVNPDGSGQTEFGFNMSITALTELNMMSGEAPDPDLAELEALLSGEPMVDAETGISMYGEERLENGSMWTYIVIEVPTLEAWGELEAALERMQPGSTDDAGEPTAIWAVPKITVDGSNVRVAVTIPSLLDGVGGDDGGFGAVMGSFMQMSYEIEMPGVLGVHNGEIDTLTGNPVWIINPAAMEDLEILVESTVE
ncbi:MAG: hypothetical protein Q9P44_11265 [Anaerolineae bacterium]|nr:hypothetical protein [Anaerolineae bacterium]